MMRRRGWSLRARLIALLLATLIPLVGLGAYSAIWEARRERAHAEHEVYMVAEHVADHAGRLVGAVQEMLAVLARLPAVQERDRREADRLARDLLARSSHLENIGRVEPDGTVVASAVPLPPGQPVSFLDKEWWPRVLRSAQPAVGGFYVGRITGKPVAHLAHPVLDGAGRVTAVVFADLRLPALSQEMARVQSGSRVLWVVVDRQDLVLLHGDPGAAIGKPLAPFTRMFRSEAGVPGTEWRVIVGIPEAVVTARVRSALLEIGLPALLIFVVAGGVGFWIAQSTWRPLQALTTSVRRISGGEPDVRLAVEGTSEVREVAIAFQGALDNLARRHRELIALLQANQAIASSLEVKHILKALTEAAVELTGASLANLLLVDEGQLVWKACAGPLREKCEAETSLTPIPIGVSFSGQVAARAQSLWVPDMATDSRQMWGDFNARYGLRYYLGVPIVAADRVLGVLNVSGTADSGVSADHRNVLESLAAQAAIALENARLHGTAIRRAEELGALLRATRAVMGGLDVHRTLQRIIEEASRITGTPHLKVLLLDEATQSLRLGAVAGRPAPMLEGFHLPLGTGLSGRVAATGQPLFVPDCQHDPRNLYADQDRELGLVAYLGLPIKIREELLGVLTFNTTSPWEYSPEEQAYLTAFADHAALAIQHARLYAEIQRHARDLEARVRERTADLEEALRVKAQFLANMSHELRTPLNAVVGFSELLLGRGPGGLTGNQERYLQRIQGGGQRLLALVNDLLEMAESQTGPADFRVDRLAVNDLVAEVLAPLAVAAKAKQVEFTTDLDPGLPSVVANRRKLAQVLHHLVANAVRFTLTGGLVTLRTRRIGTPEGEEAEFAVADTGIGIRAENLERIFRGFEQVDASDSRQYGGAGLGLALVRQLVGLHGGRVWAESGGEGQGARFIVRLPMLSAPSPRRVLVVEDEALLRAQMAEALCDAGFAVVEAPTGTEALAALDAHPPDLLVLDIVLPDMEGWEVLKRVRDEGRTRALPVLIITGLHSVQADEARARGADEFLGKPVSAQILVETVGRLLRQAAAH